MKKRIVTHIRVRYPSLTKREIQDYLQGIKHRVVAFRPPRTGEKFLTPATVIFGYPGMDLPTWRLPRPAPNVHHNYFLIVEPIEETHEV